jgi:hypothetical protein
MQRFIIVPLVSGVLVNEDLLFVAKVIISCKQSIIVVGSNIVEEREEL